MFKVLRVIAAVIAGIFTALIMVMGVEIICNTAHPFPPDFDQSSMEEMCAHVARFPDWVLAVAAVLWGITAFASTWVAYKIGGHAAALVIELLLTAAVVCNISMLPYVLWFKFAALFAIAIGIFPFAFDATRKRPSPSSVPSTPA